MGKNRTDSQLAYSTTNYYILVRSTQSSHLKDLPLSKKRVTHVKFFKQEVQEAQVRKNIEFIHCYDTQPKLRLILNVRNSNENYLRQQFLHFEPYVLVLFHQDASLYNLPNRNLERGFHFQHLCHQKWIAGLQTEGEIMYVVFL